MQMLIIVVLQFLYICNCDAFSRVKLSCQDLSCSSRIAATLSSFPSFFYKSRKATALRSRFLSDATKERIRNGKISAKEIDRIYEPSNSDRDKIMYPLSKGFVGVVFALEGSLLHLEAVLAYTWAIFAADIGKPGPSLSTVKDIIGLDFSESVLALGWTLDLTDMDRYEKRYYEILNLMIDKVPSAVREGSADLIESIINDQNKITVVTTFPREIATKLLRITKLARIFEERNINPECLIHPDQQSMWMIPGQTHFGKLMVRSLSVMEKPSILTILIDSNRRNILVAKRLGISCIAMKGFLSMNFHFFFKFSYMYMYCMYYGTVAYRKCCQCSIPASSGPHTGFI